MKKILCFILLAAGVSAMLQSCSNGDYNANTANPANGSVNPLKPLTASEFNWPAGTGQLSANINGSPWVADSVIYYLDTTGANVILGFNSKQRLIMRLYLLNTWAGNLYNMGFKQYNTSGVWYNGDSIVTSAGTYLSALGNSGELFMQQNDTAIYQGRFYFQAVNSSNQIVNVSNGYFNKHK